MGIGVVANLVAFRLHALEQGLIALDLLADDKKSGRGPALQQAVQQPSGGIRPGAVVKGQRNILGIVQQLPACRLVQLA